MLSDAVCQAREWLDHSRQGPGGSVSHAMTRTQSSAKPLSLGTWHGVSLVLVLVLKLSHVAQAGYNSFIFLFFSQDD